MSTERRREMGMEMEIVRKKLKKFIKLFYAENMLYKSARLTVEDWLSRQDFPKTLIPDLDDQDNYVDKYQQLKVSDIPLNAKKHTGRFDNLYKCNSQQVDMNMLLSRQSVSKDLPYYNGDSTEWPNFIAQYCNTTVIRRKVEQSTVSYVTFHLLKAIKLSMLFIRNKIEHDKVATRKLRKQRYNPGGELLNYLEEFSSDDEDYDNIENCNELQCVLFPSKNGADNDIDDAPSNGEEMCSLRNIGRGILRQPMVRPYPQ
ncbi:hypothetical protein FQA39_LY02798 [Lamprigera yunnana]|nr:hypothetical protein FQA39_LY02798 [Lamprigera yunnana]